MTNSILKLQRHPKVYKIVLRLNNGDRVSAIFPIEHPLRYNYIHNGKKNILNDVFVYDCKSYIDENSFKALQDSYKRIYPNIQGSFESWEIQYENLYECRKIIYPTRETIQNEEIIQFLKQNKSYQDRLNFSNQDIYQSVGNCYIVNNASLKNLIETYPVK